MLKTLIHSFVRSFIRCVCVPNSPKVSNSSCSLFHVCMQWIFQQQFFFSFYFQRNHNNTTLCMYVPWHFSIAFWLWLQRTASSLLCRDKHRGIMWLSRWFQTCSYVRSIYTFHTKGLQRTQFTCNVPKYLLKSGNIWNIFRYISYTPNRSNI